MELKLKDYRTYVLHASDKITRLKGIITGHADYITGCDQYLLQPPCKDGEFRDARWIDEGRLTIDRVEYPEGLQVKDLQAADNGADSPAPIK